MNQLNRKYSFPKTKALSMAGLVLVSVFAANLGHAISPESGQPSVIDRSDDFTSVLTPIRHAQNHQGQGMRSRERAEDNRPQIRSRNEVMREVKRRYNAEVLKISLNNNRSAYDVRVLMPNGKVRNIKVSAYK